IGYLENCQLKLHSTSNLHDGVNGALIDQPTCLLDCFNLFVNPAYDSTPTVTILSLLLKALQKIPTVVEPRSRQLIPLFLKFLGYEIHELE
ncbi:hypothetical protein PIB30_113678, partial [Stylosanthes scabra]|nr:hypothetical protein [Stylosanthes scabra]